MHLSFILLDDCVPACRRAGHYREMMREPADGYEMTIGHDAAII